MNPSRSPLNPAPHKSPTRKTLRKDPHECSPSKSLITLFYAWQLVKQLIKQMVDVIKSAKEKNKTPTIIAPITLVAAKVTKSKMTEARMVPAIPNRRARVEEQAQL